MIAFVVMEPVTALTHRLVMHGFGWGWHRSHHRDRGESAIERNDLYPLMFGSLTVVAMAIGFQGHGRDVLVPATVGITAYGACYGFVHEVYIHQRARFAWRVPVLEHLLEAHRIHHRWSQAPYGMLVPVVPHRLRERAGASPSGASVGLGGASSGLGGAPSRAGQAGGHGQLLPRRDPHPLGPHVAAGVLDAIEDA